MKVIDYYVKHSCDGVRPKCPICGENTRYVSLTLGFKRYCQNHAHEAMSIGSVQANLGKLSPMKGRTKFDHPVLLAKSESMTGENNPFFGKKHTDEVLSRIADKHRLSVEEVRDRFESRGTVKVVGDISSSYSTNNSLIEVECASCGSRDVVSLVNFLRCWRCRSCFPIGSVQQIEIFDFVRSLGFEAVSSTRKVISPLELDVYVPSKNFAIEYNGLFWHSSEKHEKSSAFDKKHHRKKFEECEKLGVRLAQFFSDEWIEKRTICESMIKNALGANLTKLNARDCEVVDLDKERSDEFTLRTHISGSTRSKHKVGLVHREMGLVAVATTRTPIQRKWGNVSELARMSFEIGCSVRGGASKLLSVVKQRAIEDGFEGVLSYADLRFGKGSVYEKCGFECKGDTTDNYWYTDGKKRFDRFKYRAQPGKSERIVAEENNVRQVWGCGNRVYVWKK